MIETRIIPPIKASQWINVDDRLPIDDCLTRVLAYGIPTCGSCNPVKQIQFCIYKKTGFFIFESGESSCSFECGQQGCSFEASHWMALPEPPT